MVHELFGPEARVMLHDNIASEMEAFCETLHPATVAETLGNEFEVEDIWKFLQHTNVRNQAAIFEYFPIEKQVELVGGVGRQHMAALLVKMSADDRADLLRRLMPRVADSLLRLVDEADRRDMATLVGHQEETAGAIMTTDYAWVRSGITVSEALDRLRLQAPDSETIYYVYVLDDARKLQGVLSLRDLILAERHSLIRDIMDMEPVAVNVKDDQEQVARELARYDLIAIPVTDDVRRLVGIVTHDDVIDIVVEEATEDVHRMGAVGPIEEDYLQANFFLVWRSRVFWLACLFVGGVLTSYAMSHFESMFSKAVLILFVPLCIATGGNTGSQAVTLITRALALGQVTLDQWWRVLRKELLMGLALGVTLGIIGFGVGLASPYLFRISIGGDLTFRLGLVISIAVVAICIWGTFIGAMLPLFFQRVGIDPGVASNPFVATLADVAGVVIYFSVAILLGL